MATHRSSLKAPLTPSLFAHIHNDAHLVGTRTLQGQEFSQTIDFLFQYIENSPHKKDLKSLSEKIKILKDHSIDISTYRKELSLKETPTTEALMEWVKKNKFFEQIVNLNPQESVLIEGGWLNREGGHAMVYEFKNISTSDKPKYVFIIHNTGAGLNYHQKVTSMDKERFCPIKVYQFTMNPQNLEDKDKLAWFLSELVKPQLMIDRMSYDASRLYEEVFPKIAYLKGELVDSFKHTNQENLTAGQRSGTCTEKVLHQMCESALPGKKAYKQFIYGLKKYSLEAYLNQCKLDGSINYSSVKNQIMLATENMARLLLKSDYFETAQQEEEHKFLKEIQLELTKTLSETPALPLDGSLLTSLGSPGPEEWGFYPKSMKPLPDLEQKETKERGEISDTVVFDPTDITDPVSAIKKLLTLSETNAEDFLEKTELFLTHYLPKDLKETKKITETKEILDNIFKLKNCYLQRHKAVYGDLITPQKTLTALNFIKITSQLSQQIGFPDFHNVIGDKIHRVLEKEKNNPYLACENPVLDKSLLTNREYWLEASKKEKFLSSYYESLISKHIQLDWFSSYFTTVSKEEPAQKVSAITAANMQALYTFQDYLKSKDKSKWLASFYETCHIPDTEREKATQALLALEADFVLARTLETNVSELWASIANTSEKQFSFSTDFFVVKKSDSPSGEYRAPDIDSPIDKCLKGHANLHNPLVSEDWTQEDQVSQVLGVSIHSERSLTSNQIQVDPKLDFYDTSWGRPSKKSAALPLSQSTIKTKELMHLRSSKTAQIKATIDFFTDHFDYLDDSAYQYYLEKNIFEPGLLIDLLDREPDALEKINAFIKRGIDIYTRDSVPSQASAFLIGLGIKINQYAYRQFTNISKDKKGNLEGITRYLENRKTLINDLIKKTSNSDILYALHRQNILLIAHTMQNSKEEIIEPKLFSEYFQSIIYLGHHPVKDLRVNKLDNIALGEASDLILKQFKRQYDTNKKQYEALLKNILTSESSILPASLKSQLTDKDVEWHFEFPTIKIKSKSSLSVKKPETPSSFNSTSGSKPNRSLLTSFKNPPIAKPVNRYAGEYGPSRSSRSTTLKPFQSRGITPVPKPKKPTIPTILISIDLRQGQIYQKGLIRDFSPNKLVEDKGFKELFREKISHVWRNQAGNYFEFNYRSTPYKAFESNRDWVFQRQFSVLKQEPQWYELVTDFSNIVNPALPKHLTALRFRGWMNGEHLLIEDKQTGKIRYCYDNKSKKVLELDQNLEETGYSLLKGDSPINKLFSQFEDPKYVEVLAKKSDKEAGEEYLVKFARYNLNLTVKPKQPSGCNIFLPNTEYRLDLESSNPIPDLSTPLIFVNDKNDKDKIVLMPAQPFVVKNEEELKESKELSEYFTLTPDIDDQVRHGLFVATHLRSPKFYNYYNSAQVIRYRVQDNQLVPNSMEDGLYLVYTYLCKRQPEQAFQLLSKLEQQFGGLTGSQKEIEYLHWIVDFVPAQIGDNAAKAMISTPEVLAIKLKALHLLASFKRDNPHYQVKAKSNSVPNTDDAQYELYSNSQIAALVEKLDKRIYALYRAYHHTEENVPANFKLSALEQLTLLRTYYLKPNRAIGPIAVVWRKLEIKNLEQELRNINKKFTSTSFMPAEILSRKEVIEKNLRKYKKIIALDSSLKQQTIKLSIKDQFHYKAEELPKVSFWTRDPLASIADQVKRSTSEREIGFDISKLTSLPINVREWIEKFPWLCQAIKKGDLKQKAELIEFCRQTILSARNKTEGTENVTKLSNVEQLATVLYVLLNNPDKFTDQVDIDKFFASELKKNSSSIETRDIQRYFDNLFKEASQLSNLAPPIGYFSQVVEEVDLADTSKLTDASSEETKVAAEAIPIVIDESAKQEFSIETTFKPEKKEGGEERQIADFIDNINKIEKEQEKELKNLRDMFQAVDPGLDFEERILKQNEIDEQAGKLVHAVNQQKLKLSIEYLGKAAAREQIYGICDSNRKELGKQLKESLETLLTSANSKYSINPLEGLRLSGRKKEKLHFNALLKLYLMGDYEEYRKQTGLNKGEIEKLHNDIAVYLWQSQQHQQLDRICGVIEKYPNLQDKDISLDDESTHIIGELGEQISAKNHVEPSSSALTVFQFCQKILIKPQQKMYLESLLTPSDKGNYHNKIIQLAMGGGKTTVLLPTLGLAKANGTNLSMIEVPDHLFRTNFSDLNEKAQRLFDQKVYGFHFKRTPPYTARDYKTLYRHMTQAIHSRSYFVTTNSSTTSLFMKYQELLDEGPKPGKEKEWQKQIKWLDRILKIFKDRTDVLLDEVHDNLNVRKQYNYTLGEPETIPSFDIKATLDLFKFFEKVKLSKDKTLMDVVKNPSLLLSQDGKKALTILAEALVTSEESPLKSYIEQLGIKEGSEKKALAEYLLNENKQFEESIAKLKDPEAKAIFCAYKQQLSKLLSHTLKNKYYENYGRSSNAEKSSLERLIAIPYAGNNEPKEGFQFGNHFVTMNYTIQGMLIEGLDFETTKILLKKLFEKAKLELIENPYLSTLDATQSGALLQKLLKKSPNEVNLEDKTQLDELYQSLRHNPEFIFHALEEEILPQITVNRKVLFSNPQHHVSMFHSVQGMTGTPWNSHTQNLDFDALPSLGTDGFTTNLLKVKKAPVHVLTHKDPKKFLEAAFEKMSTTDISKTRAIIDIGAMFRGIDNDKAAESIADYCQQNVTKLGKIKYVLFFEKDKNTEQDELFAISTDKPRTIINLGSSNPDIIQAKLGCPPEERFTYYDQRHTVGTDILQSSTAKALATVDDKTLYKDLVQGAMRMRGLAGSQSIDFFMDEETAKLISDKPTIDNVIQLTRNNQNNRLLNDHFKASIQKMDNVIRQDLFEAVLSVPDQNAKQKQACFAHFQSFFVQSLETDLFKLYGRVEKLEDTLKIFREHQKQLISQWKAARENAGIAVTDLEEKTINESLDRVIEHAKKYCEKLSLHQEAIALDQETHTESEQEREKEREQELEQEKEHESEKTAYNALDTQQWFADVDYKTLMDKPFNALQYIDSSSRQQLILKSKSLTELFQERFPDRHLVWNPNLYASPNFYLSTTSDKTYFGQYQKPIHTILMRQTKKGLTAMIIAYEELEGLKRVLESSDNGKQGDYLWAINTQGSVLSGKAPGTFSEEYNLMLEQLRFFNGDYLKLAEQETEVTWLLENSKEKLEIFAQYVLPYRLGDKRQLKNLKQRLNAIQDATAFVVSENGFFPDNMKGRFPGLKDSDVASIKTFNDFLNKVRSGKYKDITEKERLKYGSPFYLKLISKSQNEELINHYLKALDSKNLSEQVQLLLKEASGEENFEVLNIIIPIIFKNSIEVKNFNQILLEPIFIKASRLPQDKRNKVIEQFKGVLNLTKHFDEKKRISLLKEAALCFVQYPCGFDQELLNTFFGSITEQELKTIFLDEECLKTFMAKLIKSTNRDDIDFVLFKLDKKLISDYIMQPSVMQDIIFVGSKEFLEAFIEQKLEMTDKALKAMVLDTNSFDFLNSHSEAEKFYSRLGKLPQLLQTIKDTLGEKSEISSAFWTNVIKSQHRPLMAMAIESFGKKSLIELIATKKQLFFEAATRPDCDSEFLMELFASIEPDSLKLDLLNFKKDKHNVCEVLAPSDSYTKASKQYYGLLKRRCEIQLQQSVQALNRAEDKDSERKNLIHILATEVTSYLREIEHMPGKDLYGLRINIEEETQITPLMIAAKEASSGVVESIDRWSSCSLTDKDSNSKTVIDYALQNKDESERFKIIQHLFGRYRTRHFDDRYEDLLIGASIDVDKVINKENFSLVLAMALLQNEEFILEKILQTKYGQEYLTNSDAQRDYIKYQRLAKVFDKSGFKLDFSYLKNQTDEDSLKYFDSYLMSLVENKPLNVTEIQSLLNSPIGQAYLSSPYLKKNLYTILNTFNEQLTRLFLQKELTKPLIDDYILSHLITLLIRNKEPAHASQKKFLEDKLYEFFKTSIKEGQEIITQLIKNGIKQSWMSSMPFEYELIKTFCTNNPELITDKHIEAVGNSDYLFNKSLQTLFKELLAKEQEKDKEKEKSSSPPSLSFLPGYEAAKSSSTPIPTDSIEKPIPPPTSEIGIPKTGQQSTSKKE